MAESATSDEGRRAVPRHELAETGRSGRPPRRVTSADVARASGVSRATVSYVLNDVPGRSISTATRELVLRTAKELGHVPFAPARSLRLGTSNIVLALVRDYAIGFVSSRVLRQLDVSLAEHGYVVLSHRVDESVRPLDDLWRLVSPSLVVGMGGLNLPDDFVPPGDAKVLRVHGIVPHEEIGRMQARYLHSRGHRRLGYAFPSNPSLELIARERLEGVRQACHELGIGQPVVVDVDTDDPETASAAIDRWLGTDDAVDGVCAHNDEIAIILSSALASRGLRAGHDLALIGVDDIPAARLSLTSIAIDADAWGRFVADSALATLENREPPHLERDLLRLVVRDTA
ncbi:LacI family DNA-binding transcriptional regulator [Georgenia thermotolerans]|uniref:LacI family DNA-binding transcriptional regulator n=1 Tax=Georgenia thermotolerans TaxID=527326 RepID=A0A7J5UUE7_9MICO|nr:LacI family DNA-binding transcriptional regulator [Georgenia thermotolerans]KAE8765919.1 LacI family DNA-binding transcriptional regulator [Georgenia thermotolerans]